MKKVEKAKGGKFARHDDPDAEEKEVPVMGVEALKAHHEWRMIKSPKKSPRKSARQQRTAKAKANKTLTLNATEVSGNPRGRENKRRAKLTKK